MHPDFEAERELVARSCRILGKLDLTKATTGHVSMRLDENRILIRARGRNELGVRYTTADQIITVDMDGKALGGPEGLSTPQEVYIHTEIYKARPDVRSVVHIHPPTVVLFSICRKPLRPLYGAYDPSSLKLALDGIPVYPRSVLIADAGLGTDLARTMGDKCVCMMRGHGVTTVGGSVEQATINAIKLNELAEMNYRAHLLGGEMEIDEEDIESFRKMDAKSKNREFNPSIWRYYCALTDDGLDPEK